MRQKFLFIIFYSVRVAKLGPIVLSASKHSELPGGLQTWTRGISVWHHYPSTGVMSGTGRSLPLPLGPMVAIELLQKVSTSVSFGLYAHTPCAFVCSISYVSFLPRCVCVSFVLVRCSIHAAYFCCSGVRTCERLVPAKYSVPSLVGIHRSPLVWLLSPTVRRGDVRAGG